MIVEMNRDPSFHIDDAHELNRLINQKKGVNLSDAFVVEWNQAYLAYCKDREPIKLTTGVDN